MNNSAEYGENIAAFPCKIALKVYNKTEYISGETMKSLLYDSTRSNISFYMSNISSGYEIPFILEFIIMDQYGQIVTLDE